MNKTRTKRTIRQPIGFEQKEMEGYFRIPKGAAAKAITKKLSGTQLRLWLYLMMEDPFADSTNDGEKVYHEIPSPTEIALKIGANQETVEKDMRVLKKLGLYDYRTTAWEGYNSAAAEADVEAERLKQRKKAETHSRQSERLNNPQSGLNNPPERLNNPQSGLNNPPERLNNPQKTPKPPPEADFNSPHTSSDYSDFIQTLSEGEREKFLEFAEKEANRLPNPPVLIEKFVAAHFTELYKRFVASKDGREAKKEVLAQKDWKAHPQYEEWLYRAYWEGYAWVNENEAERGQRDEFLDWCRLTGAFAVFEEDDDG